LPIPTSILEDVKAFHRGKESLKEGHGADVCQRQKPPIRRNACDSHMGLSIQCLWKLDPDVPIGKDHTCFVVCFRHWRATDELGELWGVVYQFTEEGYIQVVE
jgi:hypothetical protein